MDITPDELTKRLSYKVAILAIEGDLLREQNALLSEALVHAQAQVELLTTRKEATP